jgi:hypothetical protein
VAGFQVIFTGRFWLITEAGVEARNSSALVRLGAPTERDELTSVNSRESSRTMTVLRHGTALLDALEGAIRGGDQAGALALVASLRGLPEVPACAAALARVAGRRS